MSKIKYLTYEDKTLVPEIDDMIAMGIISHYSEGVKLVIAAKGVNKATLKKIMKKEMGE